jgi:hypothetical protein
MEGSSVEVKERGREGEWGQRHLKWRAIWEAVWNPNTVEASYNILMCEDDLTEIAKSKEEQAPTGHLLPSNEASNARIGLHLIELLARGVPWESSNNLCCCRGNSLLSINIKAPLPKTTPVCLTEQERDWCLRRGSTLRFCHLCNGKVLAYSQKRNSNITQPQTSDWQWCPTCKIC